MGKRITEIDQKIIDLISERARIYTEDCEGRKDDDPSFLNDKNRTFEVIDTGNPGPLSSSDLKRVFTDIISGTIAASTPVRVAFLGPRGTFTSIALDMIFGGAIERVPQKTIVDVFHQVETEKAAFGVIPVENSTEGAVTFTLDELVETDLNIIAEQYIKISFCLMSKNSNSADIIRIYSHPQPVGQCKGWLRKNFPDAEIIHVDSTTRAAEEARNDSGSAAIASVVAADLYGLNIMSKGIEDSRQNYTRFFAVGRSESPPAGNDKTSIVCAIKDKPAALAALLSPFSESGINMTKIESRPDKKKMWEYNFFIDFLGHKDDESVKRALELMRNETVFLKILGSYPVGK